MSEFIIIIPPYLIDKNKRTIIPNKAMLPTGPLSIASSLRNIGHKVKVIDLVFEKIWNEKLNLNFNNDTHILISCHTIRNIESCKAILHELKKKRFKGHTTIGGNACIELGIKEFSKLGLKAQTVLRGYSHGLIDKIIDKITGDIFPTRSEIAKELALPAIDLLDSIILNKYLKKSQNRYPIIGHGYGCVYDCAYCTADINSRWINRPLKEVDKEIKLAKELGYNHLWCVDNLILVNPEHTIEFDRLVTKARLTWSGMNRAELTIKHCNVLPKLKSLRSLAMGVETLSSKQLKEFNRKTNIDIYSEAFHLTNKANISSTAFVMLDCPNTDENDFWNLYNYLNNDLNPNKVSISFYNPPPTEGLFKLGLKPIDYGFYKWPLGLSKLNSEKIVQQAMIMCGTWWSGWKLNKTKPFFNNKTEFGVNFKQGKIFQKNNDRSPLGDVWNIWKKRIAV